MMEIRWALSYLLSSEENTLYYQKYWDTCLYTHMKFNGITVLVRRVRYWVGPPFAAITASTLLVRLSTRFRSVSSRNAFVRSGTDVGRKAWLAVPALIHPKGVLPGWGQDSLQASQVLPPQTHSSMSLWTFLCAMACSHVGTGRGHPQTVPTRLAAQNCPKCLGMLTP